ALGYDIYATEYDPRAWREALPYVSDREDAPLAELDAPPESVVLRDVPYSPWATLHPWRIAALNLVPGPFSQLGVVDLNGTDAAGTHSWALHLEQGLGGRGENNQALSYYYDRLWTPLAAGFSHYTVRAGGLVIDLRPREYIEEQWSAFGAAQLPVVR